MYGIFVGLAAVILLLPLIRFFFFLFYKYVCSVLFCFLLFLANDNKNVCDRDGDWLAFFMSYLVLPCLFVCTFSVPLFALFFLLPSPPRLHRMTRRCCADDCTLSWRTRASRRWCGGALLSCARSPGTSLVVSSSSRWMACR